MTLEELSNIELLQLFTEEVTLRGYTHYAVEIREEIFMRMEGDEVGA